jgi:hypothetical protein
MKTVTIGFLRYNIWARCFMRFGNVGNLIC